jgi:hypothetical protein
MTEERATAIIPLHHSHIHILLYEWNSAETVFVLGFLSNDSLGDAGDENWRVYRRTCSTEMPLINLKTIVLATKTCFGKSKMRVLAQGQTGMIFVYELLE